MHLRDAFLQTDLRALQACTLLSLWGLPRGSWCCWHLAQPVESKEQLLPQSAAYMDPLTVLNMCRLADGGCVCARVRVCVCVCVCVKRKGGRGEECVPLCLCLI